MNVDVSALTRAFEAEAPTPEQDSVVDTGTEHSREETAQAGETEQQAAASEGDEGDSQAPGSKNSPHVPYDRFKSVVEEKNALKAELAEFRKAQAERAKQDDDDGLDFLDDEPTSKVTELEKRLSRFELAQEQARLEREVNAVVSQYPGLPAAVLYRAVAESPDVDLDVVAQSYNSYVGKIKAEAIAEFQKKAQQAPPPHVKRAGDGKFQAPAAPRTLEEAHAMSAKRLAGL
jgi:hypothetical protein